MDGLTQLIHVFVDVQKEYTQSNKAKDRVIIFLLIILIIQAITIGGLVYYEMSFDTVETETVTTTTTETDSHNVDVSSEGENAHAEYNNVEGNQYNDSATHNEEKGGDK